MAVYNESNPSSWEGGFRSARAMDYSVLLWLGLKRNIGSSRPTRKTLHNMYRAAEYFTNYTIAGTLLEKLARYAVSNIETEAYGEDKEEGDKFLRKIEVRETLAKAAFSAMTYGMSAIVPIVRKKKYIMCQSCGAKYFLVSLEKHGLKQYKWDKGKIRFKCRNKSCEKHKKESLYTLREHKYPSEGRFGVNVWEAYYLRPNRNEITGETEWVYKIHPETALKIRKGDHHTLCTTPKVFIDAAMNKNEVKMNSDNIYIIDMMMGRIDGMPMPPLMRAFRELELSETYKDVNKKISDDLLIPLRMLFPKDPGVTGLHPAAGGNNAYDLSALVRDQVEKWRKNPETYIPISPVAIDSKDYWGSGKLLVMHKELRENTQDIVAILGAPIEILYGGATWSRQNTSAIMLERYIQSLTEQMQGPLDDLSVKFNDMRE